MGTPVVGIGPRVQKNEGITSLLGLPWFPDDTNSDDGALDQVGTLLAWDAEKRAGLARKAASIGHSLLESFSTVAVPLTKRHTAGSHASNGYSHKSKANKPAAKFAQGDFEEFGSPSSVE
jgi:hypothetical protein